MVKSPREPPAKGQDESPAGAPPDQHTLDRPWRIRAMVAVVTAVVVGGLIGFVLIPAGQKENANLTMGHAMARAAGLESGSPAQPQPVSRASSLPVSQVSWDPQVMDILAAGRTERGAQIAGSTCAAC